MAGIDVEKLLAEISPDAPCGEDLEYDPAFGEMERSAQGKEEQQVGDTIISAEDPDWKTLKGNALAVLERSRDLRAAVFLTRALAHTDGFPGLSSGLQLIRGLHDRYWDAFHPQLDPDDDNDPTMRINALVTLCDPNEMLATVQTAPLVSSKVMGRFSIRDIQTATGELPPPSGAEPPSMSVIDGAFMDADIDELTATSAAIAASIEHARAIEVRVTELVGASQAPNLSAFVETLRHAQKVMNDKLASRGVVGVSDEEEVATAAPLAGGGAAPAQPVRGEITTREDAVRMIEKVSDWFVRNEPSSPVPLLLMRAKRLVAKSFIEIIKDMAPGGLTEAQNVGGIEPEQQY